LHTNGNASWVDEEMATLTAAKTYAFDPALAYRRIKTRSISPRFLSVLRELAAWREREAQRLDLPRNRVVRDEALAEIAHQMPQTVEELARTRSLGRKLAEDERGTQILAAIAAGMALPEADCPRPPPRVDLPRGLGPVVDLLKVLLKMKCEQFDVAQKLIASSSDIDQIAAFGEDADVPALHGWRREVFGEVALKLSAGAIALAADRKGLRTVPL
jgi:ribonuclease D